MKEDIGYYQLKKEIGEVKDLVLELMRRMSNLELKGRVEYGELSPNGEPNHISQQSIEFKLQSKRTINGKDQEEVNLEEKNRWDRLKESKLERPKIKPNRKIANQIVNQKKESFLEKKEVMNHDSVMNVIKNDKRFDGIVKKTIDEMEWLNLLKEIRDGMDAFQMGDFKLDSTREQVSSIVLNRVKKWLEDKEL